MKCSDCRFFDDLGCWYGDICENRHLLEMKLEKERKYKSLLEIKEKILSQIKKIEEIEGVDLSIPQHFTKEQSAWIKKYCIIKRKEAYNEAIDDVRKSVVELATKKKIMLSDIYEITQKLKESEENENTKKD